MLTERETLQLPLSSPPAAVRSSGGIQTMFVQFVVIVQRVCRPQLSPWQLPFHCRSLTAGIAHLSPGPNDGPSYVDAGRT